MSAARRAFCVVLTFALVSVVCAPLCAEPSSWPTPQQIAKLPAALPVGTAAVEAKGSATKQLSHETDASPTAKAIELAALSRASAPPSAYSLIEAALEYLWASELAPCRDLLNRVIADYPGTIDAGRASVLIAYTFASEGRTEEANQLANQVIAQYSDGEIQAFAALVRDSQAALLAKDGNTAIGLNKAVAAQWKGTPTGAWAAINVGDLYRKYFHDYAAAHEAYLGAAQDYAGTQFAAESLVRDAEVLNWYEDAYAQAQEQYQLALDLATTPRVAARALLGLGDCARDSGDYEGAYEVLTALIERYPESPLVSWAQALRAVAEVHLDWWEEAAQDARAALSSNPGGVGSRQRLHALLGSYAFRQGLIDEAEQEYGVAEELAQSGEVKAKAIAGLAHCRVARGDAPGALASFLRAAEQAAPANDKCLYLFQAACAAQAGGNRASLSQIVSQMVVEFPGSHLTSRLVGYEVLPPVGR